MAITGADTLGLSAEEREVAEVAYAIGARFADRRFDDAAAAEGLWDALSEAGFLGLGIPEEHGGAGGMWDLCLVMERTAAGGFPAARLVLANIVASILARHGTAEQQEAWLPRIASGEARFCFALTEPQTGSNTMNMRSHAALVDGAWRLNGEKTYISGVESANAMLAVAQDRTHGGLVLLVFDLPRDGIDKTPVHTEVALPERQWTLYLSDVELPADAAVGAPGGGGRALFDGLNPERLAVAASAIGTGRFCLDRAVDYANQRVVFDVPIGAHQAVAHPLAEAYIALEGSWALLRRAAEAYDRGEPAGVASNTAKVAACDAGFLAADRALQTFGGSGFTGETMMLQRFNFLRLQKSVPVSREMALNHLAMKALGLPKSY